MTTNHISLSGNVGRDPELRFTKQGGAVCTFSLAHTTRVKQGDTWADGDTMWVKVTCWRRTAEQVANDVTKGSRVVVTGRLVVDKWTDKEGGQHVDLAITADDVALGLKNAPSTQQQEAAPPF